MLTSDAAQLRRSALPRYRFSGWNRNVHVWYDWPAKPSLAEAPQEGFGSILCVDGIYRMLLGGVPSSVVLVLIAIGALATGNLSKLHQVLRLSSRESLDLSLLRSLQIVSRPLSAILPL